jgi:hypothetical protein
LTFATAAANRCSCYSASQIASRSPLAGSGKVSTCSVPSVSTGVSPTCAAGLHPPAHKVNDAPQRDLQQPALEPTARRIVVGAGHLLGHGNDRLLHDLLRLRVAQAGLASSVMDQPPIRLEEVAYFPDRPNPAAGLTNCGAWVGGLGHSLRRSRNLRHHSREQVGKWAGGKTVFPLTH